MSAKHSAHFKKNNFICVKLKGGLGNQMFQIAAAKMLAKNKDTALLIDQNIFGPKKKEVGFTPREFELSIFPISYEKASQSDIDYFFYLDPLFKIKKRMGLNYPEIYNSPSLGYDKNLFNVTPPAYLIGYFQSYKYFDGHEKFIRKLFSFPFHKLEQSNAELLQEIHNSLSIAVHIRRGDYVNDSITKQFHGNCSKDYYLQAIEYLTSEFTEPHFYFFSDDSPWVLAEFKDLPYKKTFIDHNTGGNSWKDMCLMSQCKHNIIANSSFSWWAAWLNRYGGKKIIAPKKWFASRKINFKDSDLIPEEWMRF